MLEFDRRYVFVPVLAAIVLVVLGLFVVEVGRVRLIDINSDLQSSNSRALKLSEIQNLVTDAETGQRGYFLTDNPSYLQPYREAKARIDSGIASLAAEYEKSSRPDVRTNAARAIQLIGVKMGEIESSIALYGDGSAEGAKEQALALINTNFGKRTMQDLRDVIERLRSAEREEIAEKLATSSKTHSVNRVISAAGGLLNIVLILVAGYFVTKDMRRRTVVASNLEEQVNKYTQDLSDLSTHLQRVTEREKSTLARELHDELGGLLVGIKIDLAQLRKELPTPTADAAKRWDRIQTSLASVIDIKRRIIEQLRPSLLDNLGVISALRWQSEQICSAAKIKLEQYYPDDEPVLTSDAAIAIFRVVQESLTNIVKHAQASQVTIELVGSATDLELTITDNGVGISPERRNTAGAHGLRGMRHRIESLGGEFSAEAAAPSGTRIRATLPMSKIAQTNVAISRTAAISTAVANSSTIQS